MEQSNDQYLTFFIRGEEYALVVLKITGRDRHGRPSAAVIGYDDTSFHVEDGDEFITAWVKAEFTRKVAS